MKLVFGSCLAALVAACSTLQPELEQTARAPAGWEGFCFLVSIAFEPGTDEASLGTRRVVPVLYDMHLRRAQWLFVAVQGGPDANNRAARALANRRAQAALRLLTQLGAEPGNVEVRILYEGEVPRLDRDLDLDAQSSAGSGTTVSFDWAANVQAMIPPDEVERNRAMQREDPRLVFC